ncbi:hypothetical protein [Streptomyces chartreusis]|uniref:hypothetical protein n=1 Tax=Streptomyces chartreusis TaxID=1969 RepID=UPI001671F688|nr:hypothetical protein [Streptomyces chartreusis]GGX57686.1 hypothetical protein GCM10010321_88290 [Streptomyces chartreusis]
MSEAFTVSIAVAGTLLGAVVTHLFQRRAVRAADKAARERDLRFQRIDAYSAYAAAVIAAANAQIKRWHYRDRSVAELESAREDSYSRRNGARQALYRVQLLASREDLTRLAEDAFDAARAIHHAGTAAEVDARSAQCRAAVGKFVRAAAEEIK